MMYELDYGSWLEEDLRDLYADLMKSRSRSDNYSDRVEINQEGLRVLAELQRRKDNKGKI